MIFIFFFFFSSSINVMIYQLGIVGLNYSESLTAGGTE